MQLSTVHSDNLKIVIIFYKKVYQKKAHHQHTRDKETEGEERKRRREREQSERKRRERDRGTRRGIRREYLVSIIF